MILIGDHQQLRPHLNVMELSKKYNLDISMFERLINNNFNKVKLNTQRRMRPEISAIVRNIYDDLQDHESVFNRPQIQGLGDKHYFFFNHDFPESVLQNLSSK